MTLASALRPAQQQRNAMSNLETGQDIAVLGPGEPCTSVEVLTPREVPLGGLRAMTVYRTLPQRGR